MATSAQTTTYYLLNKDKIKLRAAEWKRNNPERAKEAQQRYRNSEKYDLVRRNREYLRKYGITLDAYNEKLKFQHNCCAICGDLEKSKSLSSKRDIKHFSVDHCHTTGKVRGLLCDACNTLLGRAKDNIAILKNAITYLEEYS